MEMRTKTQRTRDMMEPWPAAAAAAGGGSWSYSFRSSLDVVQLR